ncbi:MAG: RyR domain-containing protein [Armatimonadota bacterium]
MRKGVYEPRPLDTEGVALPRELVDLAERLAENAHDIWARRRMDEGWRYDARLDDAAKLHPALVPYSKLPDPEKEYDRRAAMETLRAIIALGYRIVKQ